MAKIAFSERAWAEYLYWQSERSPFEGIGKPEALVCHCELKAKQSPATRSGLKSRDFSPNIEPIL